MALSLSAHSSPALWKKPNLLRRKLSPSAFYMPSSDGKCFGGSQVKALFDPIINEPLLKEALKEPVAFMGGMFAGILRLDLKEDPLKEWVTRTVEASGISEEEIDAEASNSEEEAPQQIVIE